ncbi:transketolase family protein [Lacrimispora sp. 210928-DFI.3.58]|uniref:transketolase family protein n=1 Tax=Lacrimispora sp. 210928-DFI.3.58 TaxID=2883214 RepID=UPI0015B77A82|nr:transketolase C-terminal domain-containing protein [Lacrimispora sp. 210928-DFI.3.58]MCB7317468.1 transketolase family protein [Lacrimispora sp. 210928-DFI.3.58]
MFKLAENNTKTAAMRDVLAQTLIELAKTNHKIAVLDADLIGASGLKAFQQAYPERTFDCGIQEANMVGVAAGMSECGVIPFTHTFSCFASRKCIDQAFLSACYAGLNVKMIGSDGGVVATTNGGSHQGMEDMGIYNSLPNITLVEPTDANMMAALLPQIVDTYGTFYIRQWRRCTDAVYTPDSSFEIGKGNVLAEGDDATIIASGVEVKEALKAAELLKTMGVSVRVVDMFTWRPLDKELIIQSAKKTGCIVTAENHCLASGLGHAVSACIVENLPVPMGFIGVDEQYGEVGSLDFLMKKFKLTAEDIAAKVLETIKRKPQA